MKIYHQCIVWSMLGMLSMHPSFALEVERYPALEELVTVMVREDGYLREELLAVLSASQFDQKIIDLMDRPYESLPWHRYRKLFVKESRIKKGVRFWQLNRRTLEAAEARYGVPPAIIVALIGVETHYGTNLGNRRVLNSLVTLTAGYPRRSQYFGQELRTFLNTARRENIDEHSVLGSYAGAIGIPQFMPSSYEAYAVDFNGNGKRDLVNEMEDAIGSVANYLKAHGWNRGESLYAEVTARLPASATELVSRRAKPAHFVTDLTKAGVQFDPQGGSEKAALIALTEKTGDRHVVVFRNFHVITRYNTSNNYAMAVIHLSRQIAGRVDR